MREGDRVWTRDRGLQPIGWIGGRRVSGRGINAPVRFEAGAIGNKRPSRVSPQHRMLMSGPMSELHFASHEVLAAAKHLVNGTTIRRVPCESVAYWHFMFDRHQLVQAEGCLAESFFPTARNLGGQD